METFDEKNQYYQQRVETVLKKNLPNEPHNILYEAMRYSVFNGGKRLRPIFVYATAEALKIDPEQLDLAACAVEIIHCYSLIHDDLPAMDNDDLRRGQPTCHKKYNEAIAILAGDALQAFAFQLLTQKTDQLSANKQTQMIEALATTCSKMAEGQAFDMTQMNRADITEEQLLNIYQLKTGALLEVCIQLAIIATDNLNTTMETTLLQFIQDIALAFQIQDDILDIEGLEKTVGKRVGKDRKSGKITYPILVGLDRAKATVKTFHQTAIDHLKAIDLEHSLLAELANHLINRIY